MNVVVLAKYVPNPSGTPELGPDNLLVREGVEGSLDPGDEPAIEAALEMTEKAGGEVTVVSMGPEVAMDAVRTALSIGVHKGVLITDDALRGSDTLATATVLSAAIMLQEFDLVLAAVESTDGYTGTMPQTLAEFLGVPPSPSRAASSSPTAASRSSGRPRTAISSSSPRCPRS